MTQYRHHEQFRHYRLKSRDIFITTPHSIFFLPSLRPPFHRPSLHHHHDPLPSPLSSLPHSSVLLSDHHHSRCHSICLDLELTVPTTSSSHLRRRRSVKIFTIILVSHKHRCLFDSSRYDDIMSPTISSSPSHRRKSVHFGDLLCITINIDFVVVVR